LTRSQKRRVQRLHQTEALEEILEEEEKEEAPRKGVRSEVWRVKPKADRGSSAAPINMVLMKIADYEISSSSVVGSTDEF